MECGWSSRWGVGGVVDAVNIVGGACKREYHCSVLGGVSGRCLG